MRLILKYKELREVEQEIDIDLDLLEYDKILDENNELNYDYFHKHFVQEDPYIDSNIALLQLLNQLGQDAWAQIIKNKYDILDDIDTYSLKEYDFQIYDLENNLIFSENV